MRKISDSATIEAFTSTAPTACEVAPVADLSAYEDLFCFSGQTIALEPMDSSISSCSVGDISYSYTTGSECSGGAIGALESGPSLACDTGLVAGTYTVCLTGSLGSLTPQRTTVKFELTVL